MILYLESMTCFRDQNSPFIYPMYGPRDLLEMFLKFCAVSGGVCLLNTPVHRIIIEGGKAVGIESQGKKAFATIIIGDPSYFIGIPNKTKQNGKVVRAICLLNDAPIGIKPKLDSATITIP
jgi:Rab GDP dissociation inhibitor